MTTFNHLYVRIPIKDFFASLLLDVVILVCIGYKVLCNSGHFDRNYGTYLNKYLILLLILIYNDNVTLCTFKQI